MSGSEELLGGAMEVGGDLASAYIGSQTAKKAAQAQQDALATGIGVSQAGMGQAREDMLATGMPGLEDLISGFQGAITTLEGQGPAESSAMALSGALGPEAQQQAQDAFIASPGQDWLRNQQESALLRNEAAIGGIGGGNVRSALQEQAFGRSATQQQQTLQNFMQLISPETARSSNIANLLSAGGGQIAGYRSGLGSNLANIAMGGAAQQIPLITGTGVAQAGGILGAGANVQSGIGASSKTLGQLYA